MTTAASAPARTRRGAPPATGGDGTVAPPRRRRRRNLWALPFLLPALIVLVFVVIVPSIQGAVFSFTDWDGLAKNFDFIGIQNYVELANDPLGYGALFHTLLLTLIVTVAQNVIGLLLALGLNSKIKSKGFLRLLIFIPVIVTPVIVAKLWTFMYLPNGPINETLRAMGLGGLTQLWLGNGDVALYAIMVVITWQLVGIAMVIYLAGLQGVPTEIVEAAAVDGAGRVRTFFSIVLPQLRPAIVTSSILTVIGGLKTFDQVWVMTAGGPGTSTHTLSTAMYQVAFVFGRYGYGTALAVVLAVITMVIAVIQQRALRGKAD
jgi:raffinose/stachyose/melibiose transport system permease protein